MAVKLVNLWGFRRVRGVDYSDPTSVIGQVLVYGGGGQSTPIVSVDALNKTVTTKSGSVYALGVPNLAYAAANPQAMEKLGF